MIPGSPPEAYLLTNTLTGMEPASEHEINVRMSSLGRRLESEGSGTLALSNHAHAYFRLGLPCPFLIDEACSIHDRRPMACREHVAVSPVGHCSDFLDPFIRMMSLYVSVGDALSEVAGGVAGGGVEMIPMARVREWVAVHSDLGAITWKAAFLLDRLAERCLARMGVDAIAPG